MSRTPSTSSPFMSSNSAASPPIFPISASTSPPVGPLSTLPPSTTMSISPAIRSSPSPPPSSGGATPGLLSSLEAAERSHTQTLLSSTARHQELSDQMLAMYDAHWKRCCNLRVTEKNYSSQAGQLLKRLQAEESLANTLSAITKKFKAEHKKLLAKINNPRWEVPHHYHMTCIEHHLGHRQPHVLDVAELLPGHLRIYSLARTSSIHKKSLMYYTTKTKNERNAVSEQIKESYRMLRETRTQLKEVTKLLDTIKQKSAELALEHPTEELNTIATGSASSHISESTPRSPVSGPISGSSRSQPSHMDLMRNRNKMLGLGRGPPPSASAASGGGGISTDVRMKYFKTLNLIPKMMETMKTSDVSTVADQQKHVAETYNQDTAKIANLFQMIDQQKQNSQKAIGELKTIQVYRKRMGVESLPSPLKFVEEKKPEPSPSSTTSNSNTSTSTATDSPSLSSSASPSISLDQLTLEPSTSTSSQSSSVRPLHEGEEDDDDDPDAPLNMPAIPNYDSESEADSDVETPTPSQPRLHMSVHGSSNTSATGNTPGHSSRAKEASMNNIKSEAEEGQERRI